MTDDGPLLRPGGTHDAEAVAALIEAVNRRPVDRGRLEASLADAPSVMAVDDRGLAGFAYARRFAPDVVELQNVLLAPRWRGRGEGRRLFAAVEDAMSAAGYRAVIGANSLLHPGADPEHCAAARAFWLRMGFRVLMATGGTVVLGKWLPHPADER